ncbi:DEAD/DEAH box helicase [Sphingobium sp. PNB]|uniref:DEAD/DEAH box helicase n=1 Tax=Sphingobium sp. PNB TaxID=863934 RepID=UPI001CA43E9B|nr:DEAD/DEAH box helicase [Sphingobium sp. PNB]MCB4862973.1 DEAD/DEAH box helicase [Sphingobium sp. PNB]
MIILRPYQEALLNGARQGFRERKRAILLQLATGGGKTVSGSKMIEGSSAKGLVCWWLAHRRELITQTSKTFAAMGIQHGIIAGGHSSDPHKRVQIGSVQTVARRLDCLPPPDLIIFDECHHLGASQWQKIFDAFPDAKIVGLTATPWRLDGKGLGNWFQEMVNGPTVAELIAEGSLSRYRLFAPTQIDTAAIKIQAGDFKKDDLASVMDKPSITGDAVQHYRKLCNGKRAVAFAVNVEHSQHIAAQFNANSIPAEHVDGSMHSDARDAAIARFIAGETLVLTNCELFGEGFDVPAIEAVILLRPTKSLSLHLQQVGRALRPAPGKSEAIILDHAGNSMVHGLPDDDREWSLADREKRKKDEKASVTIKTCMECFHVYRPAPKCPQCGQQPASQGREIEQRDGELAEVDVAAKRKEQRREVGNARTREDLERIARERGYKPGWVNAIMNARQGGGLAGRRYA